MQFELILSVRLLMAIEMATSLPILSNFYCCGRQGFANLTGWSFSLATVVHGISFPKEWKFQIRMQIAFNFIDFQLFFDYALISSGSDTPTYDFREFSFNETDVVISSLFIAAQHNLQSFSDLYLFRTTKSARTQTAKILWT